jgi:crotonobetainyl-CoA:carnitine CoA-transferase CaiB-like acyl-CoA transferase
VRTENRALLEQRLNELFSKRTRDAWLAELSQAGVPAAPIRDTSQVAEDPHLAERGMLYEMRDAAGKPFLTVGSPLRMNGVAAPISDRAPELGEHTQQVLREWLGG